MDGLHLVVNLYRCRGERRYSTDAKFLRHFLLDSINAAGLTALGDLFHQFDSVGGEPANPSPGGVTGCVVLAESHLAVHTWPELDAVTLDVYVCNYTQDNSDKARQVLADVMRVFEPEDYVRHDVPRDKQLMMEYVNPDHGYFIRSTARLAELRTQYQDLEVHESPQFGRLFRLDGCFMTSERDEFHYHENIVHPALTAHAAPKKALIIGGGDGGAAEEILKHPSIEQVTVVELDPGVVEMAKKYFAEVHRGAFDDPRLKLVIGDGLQFMQTTREKFDFIALDLPDPVGPVAALYEETFFRDCAKALKPGGVLALHMGSPIAQPERVQAHAERLARVFPIVRPMLMFVPLYGSLWSMACCSDTLDPQTLAAEAADKRIAQRGLSHLQYYNGATHQAIFALPNFVRELTRATQSARLLRKAASN